jgi:hypothetical protein
METFAFLHLAQGYEEPEQKEITLLPLELDWLKGWATVRCSGVSSLFLLATLSATWAFALAEMALAETSSLIYDDSAWVSIRPDGDRVAAASGACNAILPNPCTSYRPVYPTCQTAYPTPDYRPVYPDYRPVYPDSGYRPVRPTGGVFLRRGDVGSDVRYVQDLLRSAGYFDAASTGFYATLTESGVKAFQRDNGLGIDGIVGSQTLALLERQS